LCTSFTNLIHRDRHQIPQRCEEPVRKSYNLEKRYEKVVEEGVREASPELVQTRHEVLVFVVH